jgi:hypothetical protein
VGLARGEWWTRENRDGGAVGYDKPSLLILSPSLCARDSERAQLRYMEFGIKYI